MDFYEFLQFLKAEIHQINKLLSQKTALLEHIHSLKLVSRKIRAKRGLLLQKINFIDLMIFFFQTSNIH